jgi:polyisoprenyl-phosphate glycosyltransferase
MIPSEEKSRLSFVVPVYGSPDSLEPLRDRVRTVCQQIRASYEIIFVDDRCPKDSWSVVRRLAQEDSCVIGIRLSRNFGQHAAISAGLSRVTGDWIVVMDCDLQDQPEDVPAILAAAKAGGFDVVRARRANRIDPWPRKLASRAFYMVLSFLTGTHQNAEIANFGIYRRRVIDVLNRWEEESKYFPAIIEWVGFSQSTVPVRHGKRFADKSSYSLSKLISLGLNVVIGFSDAPIKLITAFGFIVAITSFFMATAVLYARVAGLITVQGWASVVLSLWFLSGCILFCMGLIGLYVGRILIETKGRPTYIIDEIYTVAAVDVRRRASSTRKGAAG